MGHARRSAAGFGPEEAQGGATGAAPLAELWRGPFLECLHLGHAAVCGPDGALRLALGDPGAVVLPRSACKPIQALPLAESGGAVPSERLALACASHEGAALHTEAVAAWLADLGLHEAALACGGHPPKDRAAREALFRQGRPHSRVHDNCSGKHAGFLALAHRLGAPAEGYERPDHPVQRAVLAAFEELTGERSRGLATDGCSAPNPACTLRGLASAMARLAAAGDGDARGRGMRAVREAMVRHPLLVAGEGRACTELMEAMRGAGGGVALKTGAEGVFAAIVPDAPGQGPVGVALKCLDGATRAAECAVAALLVRLKVLDPRHPAARRRLEPPLLDRRGALVGALRPAPGLLAP